jgi:hypothetical protein
LKTGTTITVEIGVWKYTPVKFRNIQPVCV